MSVVGGQRQPSREGRNSGLVADPSELEGELLGQWEVGHTKRGYVSLLVAFWVGPAVSCSQGRMSVEDGW